VHFHDFHPTYAAYAHVPNVALFSQQIEALRDLLTSAGPDERQGKDIDYLLALGDCFTLVVYGHLVLENAEYFGADNALLDQMFDVFIRDMNHYALTVYGKTSNSALQREKALALITAPVSDEARFEEIWGRVNSLVGVYQG
jgi:acyl-CoA dehydrogenase